MDKANVTTSEVWDWFSLQNLTDSSESEEATEDEDGCAYLLLT